MKRWIFTSRIEPADLEGTVSGRFGASVMFVSYSRVTGWHWIYPSGQEKIDEPQMLFLEPDWARAHPRTSPVSRRENPLRLRKQKIQQTFFDF